MKAMEQLRDEHEAAKLMLRNEEFHRVLRQLEGMCLD